MSFNWRERSREMEIERKVRIKDEYLRLIYDLGYDYDGLNTVESLKSLIDELVDLAKKGLNNDDKSVIYGVGEEDRKKNILLEDIKGE